MDHCHHALEHSHHPPTTGKGGGCMMDGALPQCLQCLHSTFHIAAPKHSESHVLATFLLKSVHHLPISFRINPTYYSQRIKILWDQMCLPLPPNPSSPVYEVDCLALWEFVLVPKRPPWAMPLPCLREGHPSSLLRCQSSTHSTMPYMRPFPL